MTREADSAWGGPDYVSYMLRLWLDDGGDEKDSPVRPAPWRGSLQNPHASQRLGFPSLEALFQYLRDEIGACSAPPKRIQDDQGSHKRGTWMAAMGMFLVVLLMACALTDGIRDASTRVEPPNPTATPSGDAVVIGAADRAVSFQGRNSRGASGTSVVQVTLSGPHTTISWDERDATREKSELPLLYLHQGRAATPAVERTLNLSISGLPAGLVIQVAVISLHENITTGERHTASKRFVLPDRSCTTNAPCTFEWTFEPAALLSDLYLVQVKSDTGQLLWSNPFPERPDFVALDTWDVGMGAYTVRLYYATLFPFARDPERLDRRLPPEDVPDFIERQFVSMIEDTWHTQLEEWGFGEPMHPEWDADKVVEIIITDPPFALFDGTGTYTVFADSQGHLYPERRIWWLSTHSAFRRYDLWENAHRTVYAHEFFHMAQWNVLLNTGRPANYWLNTFIEAQAEFAVGVQYPDLELGKRHVLAGSSSYGNSANSFLVHRLNSSYQHLEAEATNKYDLALYWRFLYEQFGDMAIIRAALKEMGRQYQPDIVKSMRSAMDATITRFDGPFHTYEESLIAFARANYALRLENGRCENEDLSGCGDLYYDPDGIYLNPSLAFGLDYYGEPLTYGDVIPSSFGMDFVGVGLNPMVQGQELTIRIQGTGDVARFSVQVWRLKWGEEGPWAVTSQPDVVGQEPDGAYIHHIPTVDTTAYDRLALIITRLDGDESVDPVGAYQLTIGS